METFRGVVGERPKIPIEEIRPGYKVRMHTRKDGSVTLLFFRNGGRRGEKVFCFEIEKEDV